MASIPGVTFIQVDVMDQNMRREARNLDLVLSDMAPNMSGTPSIDLPRAMALAELALEVALDCLSPTGSFLVKLFQGEGFAELRQQLLKQFARVKSYKPKASRPRSREVYLLARR
jgi:23S rRNA (uridine2552-2'-O)-methyltransferase